MRHKIVLLGIILLVLSTQVASVQALSSCNGIWVETESIEMERNYSDDFHFRIHNYEDQGFHLTAKAWPDYGDFDIWVKDYTNYIDAKDNGEITVTVETPALDEESQGRAYIMARGYFDDGRYCNFGSIDYAYFEVDVIMDDEEHGVCSGIKIRARDVEISEDSTKTFTFYIENDSDERFELYDLEIEENSPYVRASVYSKPRYVGRGDEESFRVRIEAENVSRDKEVELEIRAEGRFSGGERCSLNEIDSEEFEALIEDEEGIGPEPEPDEEECDYVYLNAGRVIVEKGKTGHATIFLENDSEENFLIDYVSVFDLSPDFRVEEAGYAKIVPAFGNSYINVKAKAHEYAETGSKDAFVEVKGHFQNRESCSIGNKGYSSFQVEIKEAAPDAGNGSAGFSQQESTGQDSVNGNWQGVANGFAQECSYVSLSVPKAKSIGNSGIVPIVIDNRSMERITVRLSGPGLTVEPKLISVPEKTLISENLAVSSVIGETRVVYSVEGTTCNMRKETLIFSESAKEEDRERQEEEVLEALSTGFAFMGQASAAVGVFVIAAILAILILRH